MHIPLLNEDMARHLKTGLTHYALCRDRSGSITAIIVSCLDGKAISVFSRMHSIEPRFEVSALSMSNASDLDGNCAWNELPDEWSAIAEVSKFSVEEVGPGSLSNMKAFVDAGISLNSRHGSELSIFAAAFPLTIAISAQFLQGSFEPQYPVAQYQRERIVT